MELYTDAAEQGYAHAQFLVGMYTCPCVKHVDEVHDLYRRAAFQGHTRALFSMRNRYQDRNINKMARCYELMGRAFKDEHLQYPECVDIFVDKWFNLGPIDHVHLEVILNPTCAETVACATDGLYHDYKLIPRADAHRGALEWLLEQHPDEVSFLLTRHENHALVIALIAIALPQPIAEEVVCYVATLGQQTPEWEPPFTTDHTTKRLRIVNPNTLVFPKHIPPIQE